MALVLGAPLGFFRCSKRRHLPAPLAALRKRDELSFPRFKIFSMTDESRKLLKGACRGMVHLVLPLLLLSSPSEFFPADTLSYAASSLPPEAMQNIECTPACEESYGFLPCSANIGGSLFLVATYGFLLLVSAKLISQGSELLLEVMNPGLIGGLVLPVLGALPDSLLVLSSGLGGTVEEAQSQVMVGVGVLAGSTTIILTLAWAGSLWTGRCDLSSVNGVAEDGVLSKKNDLFQTGVTTDSQTRWGAWIMMASTVSLVCAQVPLLDGHPAEGPEAALVGSILSFTGLLAYCSYQVVFPWLQQKRIEEARMKFLKARVLQEVSTYPSKSLSLREKQLSFGHEALSKAFKYFDRNGDGRIEGNELEGFIVGLGMNGDGSGAFSSDLVNKWLREFDVDLNETIAEHEFVQGLSKWVVEATKAKQIQKLQQLEASCDPKFWAANSDQAEKVLNLLQGDLDDVDEADDKSELSNSNVYARAIGYLLSGAALAAVFADPLVNSIEGLAKASQVPPFYIAFVVIPLASNGSELFSSITFAMKKRKRNISLTFSQIYGAVTMNNTLCLGIFLALVYLRGLTWDFSSEVTAILITTFLVGILGASRTTFPAWLSIPVLALYPLSIAGITFLDNYLGWH